VHAAAVIREQRLGHERHGLAVLVGHVADDVLVQHHVVGRLHQLVEALVDFGLAAGGHFVVVALDVQPALDHGLHHLAAQILVMIRRRHREVAFLVARPVAQVVLPRPEFQRPSSASMK
jgi:predicted HAD superfamily Cof-like phosphohydrolase